MYIIYIYIYIYIYIIRLEVDAATLREGIQESPVVALLGVAFCAFDRADAEGDALVPRVDGRVGGELVAATRGVGARDAVVDRVLVLPHNVHPRIQVRGSLAKVRVRVRVRVLGSGLPHAPSSP